jgi:uncharacterized protein YrrD
MSRLVRASELIGMPLITLDTADVVGEVRDVLTDPQAATVAAFTVRGRGLLSPALIGVLPIDRVHAIGRDALIIATADTVVAGDEPGLQPTDQPEVIGRSVVTGSGDGLGTVTDLVVEVEDGAAAVVGLEIERADGQRLLTPLNGRPLLEQDPLVIAEGTPPATYGLAGLRRLLERAGPGQIAPV